MSLLSGRRTMTSGRGREPSSLRKRHLRFVVAPRGQTRCFEHALEHELAPRALRARIALERAREIDRVLADALVELLEALDFLREHAALALVARMRLADRLAEFLELHLQRIEQAAELQRALLAQVLRPCRRGSCWRDSGTNRAGAARPGRAARASRPRTAPARATAASSAE